MCCLFSILFTAADRSETTGVAKVRIFVKYVSLSFSHSSFCILQHQQQSLEQFHFWGRTGQPSLQSQTCGLCKERDAKPFCSWFFTCCQPILQIQPFIQIYQGKYIENFLSLHIVKLLSSDAFKLTSVKLQSSALKHRRTCSGTVSQ